MNTNLRQKAKNNFEKDECSFWKNYGKCKKHRSLKTCYNRKEKKLFSIRTKLSHYKVFHIKCISNRNEKTQITMNKPVYLGLSILDLSKTVIFGMIM